jgi:restriction system protein
MNDYAGLMKPWHEQMEAEWASMCAAQVDSSADESEEAELVDAHFTSTVALRQELLGRIHAQSAKFFEQLIIDVMLAMGYGGRRRDFAHRLGRKGDGGIDGVIEQDELGLDLIYLQAKRYKLNTRVPLSDVRDFAGSLDAHHATKGVFVATGKFTKAAGEFVGMVPRRIVLIDGMKLAELMVRHNIGVRIQESYQFKRLDGDYFSPEAFKMRMAETSSADTQPRR